MLPIGKASIAEAAAEVLRGGLVVFPTDTVYGLGCDPFDEEAVARLFRAKGRGAKAVPVLCSTLERAAELVVLKGKAKELAEAHWPGALTIVAPLRKEVPRLLVQGGKDLGVRVPGHALCRRLLEACGGWLTGTSANVSGRPSARTAADAVAQLGNSVGVVLDGGALGGRESTVVRVDSGVVTILRTGSVGVADEMRGRRTS